MIGSNDFIHIFFTHMKTIALFLNCVKLSTIKCLPFGGFFCRLSLQN